MIDVEIDRKDMLRGTDLRGVQKIRRMQQHMTENMVVEVVSTDIESIYDIRWNNVLGRGVSGSVIVCRHKTSGVQYALKTLNKAKLNQKSLETLGQEVRILAELDHPNIIRLHESFETPENIHLVVELCSGGELLDKLQSQKDHRYSEYAARKLIYSMLSAVRYCHDHNIVHRDLKLENFLFENNSPSSDLKLIDFGLSQQFQESEFLHTSVGTPYYVAPEVIRKHYNSKCDIWSIGVLAYMLLSGTPPFNGASDTEIINAVREGKYQFDPIPFNTISIAGKDFISKCLTKEISLRPTAEAAQRHPWFQYLNERCNPVSTPILQRLMNFPLKSRLCRVFMEVVAHTMHPRQIRDIKEEFSKYDLDNNGEITQTELHNVLKKQKNYDESCTTRLFTEIDVERTGKIHYREFVAASLSMQDINEENMKVAFDKLSHHNDFVTAENIRELLGRDATNEEVQEMITFHQKSKHRFDYEEFKNILLHQNVEDTTDLIFKSTKSTDSKSTKTLSEKLFQALSLTKTTITNTIPSKTIENIIENQNQNDILTHGVAVEEEVPVPAPPPVSGLLLPSVTSDRTLPSILDFCTNRRGCKVTPTVNGTTEQQQQQGTSLSAVVENCNNNTNTSNGNRLYPMPSSNRQKSKTIYNTVERGVTKSYAVHSQLLEIDTNVPITSTSNTTTSTSLVNRRGGHDLPSLTLSLSMSPASIQSNNFATTTTTALSAQSTTRSTTSNSSSNTNNNTTRYNSYSHTHTRVNTPMTWERRPITGRHMTDNKLYNTNSPYSKKKFHK